MRPNHYIYKHKQNEKAKREQVKTERMERLAELEEQYKIALENSQNENLVAQYNQFIAVKKEYETYDFVNNFDRKFDVEKAISEISAVISEFRITYVGVDKRDLESIKTQLAIYRSFAPNSQVIEPEM
ncbi:MAG: hypothetical protein IJX17_01765 [Clostridia bacterium]|nr:hypothetical protein [Clostridia bacterium]